VTANPRAFRVMVRNAAFLRIELAARRDTAGLAGVEGGTGWDEGRWQEALAPYFSEHTDIGTGPEARAGTWVTITEHPGTWRVHQVVDDPAGYHEWALDLEIDLGASDAAGEVVARTRAFGPV
jgi:hypothetical protein